MRIGIDIGGVIIDRVANGQLDTTFKISNYTKTPPIDGAFLSIKQLVTAAGARNIFLVSVVDQENQIKTDQWLHGNRFYEVTGMTPSNLKNCRQRQEKAIIAKELQLTHFIDDRPDVLEHMIGIVPNLYLFQTDTNTQISNNDSLTTVHGWSNVMKLITLGSNNR